MSFMRLTVLCVSLTFAFTDECKSNCNFKSSVFAPIADAMSNCSFAMIESPFFRITEYVPGNTFGPRVEAPHITTGDSMAGAICISQKKRLSPFCKESAAFFTSFPGSV